MRRVLALLTALCLALGMAGCGRPALSPDVDEAPGLYAAGAEAAGRGDWAGALDAYTRAIEAGEDRAAAYAGRGDCYLALAGLGESEPGPDLRALARRDYEAALAMDPALGAHIYEVYADLAEDALAAGDGDKAMDCLAMARKAAPEQEEGLREQMKALTGGMLPGSVWYQDGPDSRYYVFAGDGTGRIVDAVDMEPAGDLSYENEGFSLIVTENGESRRWTYDPNRACYDAEPLDGEALPPRLGRTSLRWMYAQWQADILAREAEDTDAGYEDLYEREFSLLKELSSLTGERAALRAERKRRKALEAGETAAREAFNALRETVNGLLQQLPAGDTAGGADLGELFPVGEQMLLDYFRLLTAHVLQERGLALPAGAEALDGWESLADVDHYFQDGRLYLRLNGYALREGGLVPEGHGRLVFATPLTYGDPVTAQGDELLALLAGGTWTGLWEPDYGGEAFFLELTLSEDMTCSLRGGHAPAGAGVQSGEYALQGRELTLTLAADGYTPGTYRYQVVPMGESLYMTLLTDGAVYGQSAGSAFVFCRSAYEAGMEER